MMIGELIDYMEPYRGRGDSVVIWDEDRGNYRPIKSVWWNERLRQLEIELVEGFQEG